MTLEEVIKASAKLSDEELSTLETKLHSWRMEKANAEREEIDKKLKAFATAVRRAGIHKILRGARRADKQVKLPVELFWEYDGELFDLEGPEDVRINVHIRGNTDELLDKLFKVQAREERRRIYSAFKRVNDLAKKYGVKDLNYAEAVGFLWED